MPGQALTGSPKVNPDLLQRSEVVALFNTLHRISESLSAVDDFRKMYAATQATSAESAKRRSGKGQVRDKVSHRTRLTHGAMLTCPESGAVRYSPAQLGRSRLVAVHDRWCGVVGTGGIASKLQGMSGYMLAEPREGVDRPRAGACRGRVGHGFRPHGAVAYDPWMHIPPCTAGQV